MLALTGMFAGGCAADDGDTGSDANSGGDAVAGGTIKIGWMPWDEDIAATYLWERILEDEGYDVELTQLDVAPVFEGVASGDLDLFFDAWLPSTHEDYWAEYGDRLEDLAVWYDNGLLTWAVPEYMDVDSIEDLAGMEGELDGRIVGIEPGAGLTRLSREAVMPDYGLDGYELIEGSTPAMLAELERAIKNEAPIVVTLWRPHWAYSVFPIKDLADPKGSLGEAEELHAIARAGFSADHPEAAEWIGAFKMNDDQLAELEDLVLNEYGAGQEAAAVEEWLSDADNRALVDGWLGR
ncbi:MAG: glycine betaine ABC transporter substrate-binding protein [Coriobacteriia bacterium]|nr:glycine betaine ABC transporter substrate-binding protein [Coriobacteriia bacterium]